MDASFSQTQAVVEQKGNPETGHHEESNVVIRVDAHDLPVSLVKIASEYMRLKNNMKINHTLGIRGYLGKQKMGSQMDDDFKPRSQWGKDMSSQNKAYQEILDEQGLVNPLKVAFEYMPLKNKTKIKHKLGSRGYMGKQRVGSQMNDDFKPQCQYGKVHQQLLDLHEKLRKIYLPPFESSQEAVDIDIEVARSSSPSSTETILCSSSSVSVEGYSHGSLSPIDDMNKNCRPSNI